MDQSCSLPFGIFKDVPRTVGIQVCKTHSGYCITAHESASDARAQKDILIELNESEIDYLIGAMQRIRGE